MTADAVPTISFARDVRPLFRDFDIHSMLKAFDLSNYDQVSARADAILKVLESGKMPCDGPWPQAKLDIFRQWIGGGKLP
jgi:hypothetical protein